MSRVLEGLEPERVFYYFEELTLKEIGMIIGVSESRVSQLHSKALIKLKNMLKRVNVF